MQRLSTALATATCALLLGVGALAAHAQPGGNGAPRNPQVRDPGVNARQHHQHDRVRQGVGSGQLTRDEAQALRQEQRTIRQQEHEAKSDGQVTRTERRELHQELNQASQNIYAEKHDAEQRPPR